MLYRVRAAAVAGGLCAAIAAGCGEAGEPSAPGPQVLRHSGVWYRALPSAQRTRVADACRAAAASGAPGDTAREQLRAIDVGALRVALDNAYTIIARQRLPIASLCRRVVPFHTPGLRVSFAGGARDRGDGAWSVQAISTRPYTIRGRISGAHAGARISARRMDGYTVRGAVGADGAFRLPVRFRRVADNTFTLTIEAPPAALRRVLFTAICLDCLAGSPAPSPS
jgi:hypothetical protein